MAIDGAFCDEHGWSRARLLWELKNERVRCPHHSAGARESEIDWHDPRVQESLDIENSQVTARDPEQAKTNVRGRGITFVDVGAETLDIEVRLAAEATADAPRRSRWQTLAQAAVAGGERGRRFRRAKNAADDICDDYPTARMATSSGCSRR